jgi:putative tryptophan/tyrosine transport system substrate-binding protein
MERREFIKIVCGFVGTWPLAAEAQQPENQRLIGILGADATVWRPWTAALTTRLHELGWSEGDNVAIEYRWALGRSDRVSEIAAEFERRKVDAIVTYGSAATILRQTITTIPIVFAVAFDPVRGGLVQSLEHPAGNVTGVSIQQPDLVGKRLKLLRQAIPQLQRLGILADAGYAEPMLEADRVKSMAQASGLEAARIGVWRAEDIAPAFEALRNRADALYVVSDALMAVNRTRIVTLALSGHLPTMMSYDDYVEAGGLMSYGPNYPDLFRKAAEMVDKILRGTKTADIPVEQPAKFEFAINAKTAAALGLTIPQTFLATVDEVLK